MMSEKYIYGYIPSQGWCVGLRTESGTMGTPVEWFVDAKSAMSNCELRNGDSVIDNRRPS